MLSINEISEKLTNRMLRKNIIGDEEVDIYQYGFEQLILSLLNFITAVIIGVGFKMLWQCILVVFFFMIIRTYSGGYHTKTPKSCYLLTAFSIILMLSVIKCVHMNTIICMSLLCLSGIIIMFLSPVESVNKPLDSIEKREYKRKTIFIVCTEIVIAVIFLFLNTDVTKCIAVTQGTVGISIILGYIKH